MGLNNMFLVLAFVPDPARVPDCTYIMVTLVRLGLSRLRVPDCTYITVKRALYGSINTLS